MTDYEVTLTDKSDGRMAPDHDQLIHIEADQDAIALRPEGYGEASAGDGSGFPVLIEKWDGELRVIVWADINRQDPTHIISLEGARESARKETVV